MKTEYKTKTKMAIIDYLKSNPDIRFTARDILKAVKRDEGNLDRSYDNLRSQIATSSEEYGGRRYLPYVFTEQGIAMLSAVLNSETAINVSIKIMSAFVLK